MTSEQKILAANTMLLYGELNLSNPFTVRHSVDERGEDESFMAKLLFPAAYKLAKQELGEDYHPVWEGTYYPAGEVIKAFRSEGINFLKKKYECNDLEFLRRLKRWLNFIEFMGEQERDLNEPCRIIVHVTTW